jgi:hypothetical protein
LFFCLRRPDVILFVLLPVRILDGDASPLPGRLNDSRFDEYIALLSPLENPIRFPVVLMRTIRRAAEPPPITGRTKWLSQAIGKL